MIKGILLSVPVGILTWVVVGSIPNMFGNFGFIAAIFVLFIGPAAGYGAGASVIAYFEGLEADAKRRQAAEAARKAEELARQQRHREEQQGYRNQMVALGEQSLSLFESLPKFLSDAEKYLDQTEIDFADGAFAPFWDSIENAAKLLGRFDEGVQHIKNNLSRYTELIRKYEDTSPQFPLTRHSVAGSGLAIWYLTDDLWYIPTLWHVSQGFIIQAHYIT